MTTSRLRLGQLLVDARLITQEALDDVLAAQKRDGRRLGTLIVERGYISEVQLTQILSHQLSVPWVSLLKIEFSRQLLNLVPREIADQYCVLPIYVRRPRGQGDTLYIAMEDPTNEEAIRSVSAHSGIPVRPMIAPPSDIRSAIRAYYGLSTAETEPPPPISEALPAQAPNVTPEPRAVRLEPDTSRATDAPAPSEVAPLPETLASPARSDADDATKRDAEPAQAPPQRAKTLRSAMHDNTPTIEITGEMHIEIPPTKRASSHPPSEAGDSIRRSRPPTEERPASIPAPRGKTARMVSLTLLDGTTITLPARSKRPPAPSPDDAVEVEPPRSSQAPERESAPPPEHMSTLTARDLVAALRVVASGADASAILGDDVRWETMFAALLSLMLRKQIIADWEFVEELNRLKKR
ncbi:MAG: hypothetical protein U0441_24595 [Polyangiaceae bacterium]